MTLLCCSSLYRVTSRSNRLVFYISAYLYPRLVDTWKPLAYGYLNLPTYFNPFRGERWGRGES